MLYGQAVVLRSEEEDSSLVRTIITKEEVYRMRQTLETTAAKEKKPRGQRTLLSAPAPILPADADGLTLLVNTTMQAEQIGKTFEAATAFCAALGEGSYRVALKISRIEGDGDGAEA